MIRQFFKTHSSNSCNFFITFFTLICIIPIQNFSLNHTLQTLFNVFHIFNLKIYSHKRLFSFAMMITYFANYFYANISTKMFFNYIRIFRPFKLSFYAVHQHIKELINIHLFINICGVALIVLKSMTKTFWIKGLFFAFF